MDKVIKILILGDIYGTAGKLAVSKNLKKLKKDLSPDIVIANAENVSEGGKSLIKTDYDLLNKVGINYFTMGNHTFKNKEILNYIYDIDNLVTPANLEEENIKNKEFIIFKHKNKRILLFNLLGVSFISNTVSNPFKKADQILNDNKDKYDFAILDFHAEATAEKIVLANYLSDRVAVLFGTHTHIQTADERILNNKIAYITDVGMCGVYDSAIGADFKAVELKMIGKSSIPFEEAKGKVRINGALITIDYENNMPISIERIQKDI